MNTFEGIGSESLWICPSLDNDGNGTATAYDVSGNGFHATLTDMDPATDWVADTANGGVRALDFDGVDDQLVFASSVFPANTNQLSMSAWIRRPTAGTLGPFFGLGNGTTTNRIEIQPWSDNLLYVTFTSSIYGYITLDQAWHHYVVVYDGTAANNTQRLRIFRDGVQQTVTFVGTIPTTVGTAALTPRIGQSHAGNFGAGQVDDLRVFSVQLFEEATRLSLFRGITADAGSNPALIHHLRQMAVNA